jgi:general secretion pathway protein F
MGAFRYDALEAGGKPVSGIIEADDRRTALSLLAGRGIFAREIVPTAAKTEVTGKTAPSTGFRFGSGVPRKKVTAFTNQLATLLSAGIAIPQALDSLAHEEEHAALKEVVTKMAESVRKGHSLSAAMEEHPAVFNHLYASMIRVGEEAGALQGVLIDLAALLEREDEVRGEVMAAVSYPLFVLAFGILTVIVLMTVILPRLFTMLQQMLKVLPLPTLILLRVSSFFHYYWWAVLLVTIGAALGIGWYRRTPKGAFQIDRLKLALPVLGSVFLASALARFARTLGTLVKSGVSLLPSLKIVENTIGNLVLAKSIAQVGEEARGGDSLAAPLRKLRVFPGTITQMISVGEESGKLDEMLLKVAEIQEREMRAKTKMLISLLAPALILVVGAIVGFIVIALLVPIFSMSRNIR